MWTLGCLLITINGASFISAGKYACLRQTDSEAMRVFLLLPFGSLASDMTLSGLGSRRPNPLLSQALMGYVSFHKAFPFSASVLVIMGMIIPAHLISQTGGEARVHLKIQKETLNPSQIGISSI